MKKTFEIGTGIFGLGNPKICVPIVAEDREEIWKKAEEIEQLPVDMIEWRADFYRDVWNSREVLYTLRGIKERAGKKAVLFTFRTLAEGGQTFIEKETYHQLNLQAAGSGLADMVDVEAFPDEERTKEEIAKLRREGIRVIASSHDFKKTPGTKELVERLLRMEELGADVAKIAVMPTCRQDVLNLLQATVTADESLQIPLVTMSMGRLGAVSRLCGSLTGSAMTFASLGECSAPGQVDAKKMYEILNIWK